MLCSECYETSLPVFRAAISLWLPFKFLLVKNNGSVRKDGKCSLRNRTPSIGKQLFVSPGGFWICWKTKKRNECFSHRRLQTFGDREKIPELQAHVNRPAAPVARVWAWRSEGGKDHGGRHAKDIPGMSGQMVLLMGLAVSVIYLCSLHC